MIAWILGKVLEAVVLVDTVPSVAAMRCANRADRPIGSLNEARAQEASATGLELLPLPKAASERMHRERRASARAEHAVASHEDHDEPTP